MSKEIHGLFNTYANSIIASKEALGMALKPEVAIENIMDDGFNQWLFMFRKHIPVIELAKEEFPENWWQAVRNRWLPHWWLRRFPVKYRKIKVNLNLNRHFPPNRGNRFTLIINDELVSTNDWEDRC